MDYSILGIIQKLQRAQLARRENMSFVTGSLTVGDTTLQIDDNTSKQVDPNVELVVETGETMTMTVMVLWVIALLISISVWIVALYFLRTKWDDLNPTIRIIGVIGLLPIVPFGPLITLALTAF